jgi:RNA polymerase sigma factor (TIGR02999 family)
MTSARSAEITRLLVAWSGGDEDALARLTPLVYDALYCVARAYMRRERMGHSLQPTALVNEAYLRLVDSSRVHWRDRTHFLAVAAQLMRRILVDHARGRRARKRGGERVRVTLAEIPAAAADPAIDLIALDDALSKLAQLDPRKARVVELRFFGGLTIDEAARVLNLSGDTLGRDWIAAKAWLRRALRSSR